MVVVAKPHGPYRAARDPGYNDHAMRVISQSADANLDRDLVLTIGSFDGVHCGHQSLIRGMVRYAHAAGMLAAVLTFYPHPREVLQPGVTLRYLTTDAERARLFEAMGLDLLVLEPFNRDVAATTARDFVVRLHEELRMRELWAGPDFALGRDRQGTIPELARLGAELGYDLHVVDRVQRDDQPVSSTRIRSLIEEGEVAQAAAILGRHFGLNGVVRYGAQRGRRLGFRTANLRMGPLCGCPDDGVYAVWALTGGTWHPGVANLGRRPSFDMGERMLEVHLLDYSGNLYGQRLRVLFVERLRGERRFEDAAQLVSQVQEDMHRARGILAAQPPLDETLCLSPRFAS
jgi:riboflavin kinase/FMN adenylyltransferase